ncbi:MAG TPA: Gfo/Idh/MocA family oxidoreductase [Acetobacteraceae bacterium]|nr:Gfo/Idh/MocA family oxidoreductase [Acetobacteraceae bacterium]
MKRARIGVIGAGWWAALSHLPTLKANPDCEVVAISRLGAAELEQVRSAFGVPLGFEDAQEMLRRVELDGAIVSSPHVLHHEHAIAAIEAGCHVLVEKPLATKAADAREIVARAQAHGREVIIPHGWNFTFWTERARSLVASGRIGRIEHVVLQMASALDDLFAGQPMQETADHMFRPPPSTWADPARAGGYGWGQLVHALGLMFRITDLRPHSVFAMTGRSQAGVDFYDAAALRFACGATAAVSGAATVPKHRGFQLDLRLFGSEGILLLDIERARLELRRRDGADVVEPITDSDTAYRCVAPVNALVDICLGRPALNAAPGETGLRAVEVLDALYRSAASGRIEEI